MSKAQDIYKVDKVVGQRNKQGKVLYKVHWTNFSAAHDSWEPAENLGQCQELIDEYKEKQAAINRRKSLRSHSSEPQHKPTLETSARETHSVTAFSSDEEADVSLTPRKPRARKQPAKSPGRPRTKSPARASTKSPVKGRGRPPTGKKTVADVADSDPQTVGLFTYNFRSTQTHTGVSGTLAALSSDEENPGTVGARMSLTESKFRQRLAEISFVPKVVDTSTPNSKSSIQSTSTTTRSNSRVKTTLKVGMRKEQITAASKAKPAELSVCEEADDAETFPAEAPPLSSAQEQAPPPPPPPQQAPVEGEEQEEEEGERHAQKERMVAKEEYPSWLQLGIKEFVLVGVVGGIAALGYACYYSDACNFY